MHDTRHSSCEGKIVGSFMSDQVVFVDIVVTLRQNAPVPGHSFKENDYVNGEGDVACLSFGRCQLKFRLLWNSREFKTVMFDEGNCLVIGLPDHGGCAGAMADPPFHDVLREPTGQMVSVINDNPVHAGTWIYAYRLDIVATRRDGVPQRFQIDPRIINRSRPQ